MSTPIILVHGAFHTGACWDLLVPHLTERGFDPVAITLGGHGQGGRPASQASLQTYAGDIIATAERIGHPSLLLGHSLGGMGISQAGELRPELFSALIYLTAFAPPFGSTATTDLPYVTPAMAEGVQLGMKDASDGAVPYPDDNARTVFYSGCGSDVQDYALARTCAQPLGAMFGSVDTSAGRLGRVTRHYIECTRDNALSIEGQRAMQANMEFRSVASLASDHSPFYSMPTNLAETIRAIAKEHSPGA